MSSRIVDLNGAPAKPEPPNVPDMIKTAKVRWNHGEKHKAFEALCDACLLLAQGVGRNINDAQKLQGDVKKLEERITPK